MAAVATLARRTTFLRSPLRSAISPSFSSIPSHLPSRSSTQRFQRPLRISSFRRGSLVLNSMLPIHSAIASARLVSKLPSEASACIEGRFANYLSPI